MPSATGSSRPLPSHWLPMLAHLLLALSVSVSTADSTRAATASNPLTTRAKASAKWSGSADSIVVEKSKRLLTLYRSGMPVRTYLVALGENPVGDKVRMGDNRTPEGVFFIQAHNPGSRYHLSLRISYPDAAHRTRAAKMGVSPGGDIMLHGLPPKYAFLGERHRAYDWTQGCIALTNDEIEEIYAAVQDRTPIEIKP